jgi:hypothetical protein
VVSGEVFENHRRTPHWAILLEYELQRELNLARWKCAGDGAEVAVGDVTGWRHEIRPVLQIERFAPELQAFVFQDRERFLKRQIELEHGRTAGDVPASAAEWL